MNADLPNSNKFIEALSMWFVIIGAVGGFIVLLDPRFSYTLADGSSIALGGDGFPGEIKGMVVQTMMIGGIIAVQKFWLDATAASNAANKTMSTIAVASAPVAAAAVAAATGAEKAVKIQGRMPKR